MCMGATRSAPLGLLGRGSGKAQPPILAPKARTDGALRLPCRSSLSDAPRAAGARLIRLQPHKSEFVQSGAEPTGINSVPLGRGDACGVLDLLLRFSRPARELEDERQRSYPPTGGGFASEQAAAEALGRQSPDPHCQRRSRWSRLGRVQLMSGPALEVVQRPPGLSAATSASPGRFGWPITEPMP